ncbi:unnamed protein product, partial [Bubo scandiacus]
SEVAQQEENTFNCTPIYLSVSILQLQSQSSQRRNLVMQLTSLKTSLEACNSNTTNSNNNNKNNSNNNEQSKISTNTA